MDVLGGRNGLSVVVFILRIYVPGVELEGDWWLFSKEKRDGHFV